MFWVFVGFKFLSAISQIQQYSGNLEIDQLAKIFFVCVHFAFCVGNNRNQ